MMSGRKRIFRSCKFKSEIVCFAPVTIISKERKRKQEGFFFVCFSDRNNSTSGNGSFIHKKPHKVYLSKYHFFNFLCIEYFFQKSLSLECFCLILDSLEISLVNCTLNDTVSLKPKHPSQAPMSVK